MAKIVLATFGSLGDLHPKIALALELEKRGHDVSVAAMEFYREKIKLARARVSYRMAPHLDPKTASFCPNWSMKERARKLYLKGIIMPALGPMFADLMSAVEGADLLVTGEVVLFARSVVEKTGVKWVSTSLAPISFFSAYDPPSRLPPAGSKI